MLWGLLVGCTSNIQGTGVPDTSSPIDTDTDQRVWEEISMVPCARDSEGYLECWSSASWDDMPTATKPVFPPKVPVLEISPNARELWGVREDDDLPYFFTEAYPPGEGPPSLPGFQNLTTQCARLDTEIICWGSAPSSFPAELAYTDVDGYAIRHAALTTDNQLLIRTQGSQANARDFLLDPAKTYIDVAQIDPSSACALTDTGEIECYGSEPIFFDNPPYVMLRSGNFAVCAAREDWVIECRDGSSFDFGPLRDMEVATLPTFSLENPGTESEWWRPAYPDGDTPPHICVITQDNAVRCQGWNYDFPDLQAALPAGD